jgi:hypothetical protein
LRKGIAVAILFLLLGATVLGTMVIGTASGESDSEPEPDPDTPDPDMLDGTNLDEPEPPEYETIINSLAGPDYDFGGENAPPDQTLYDGVSDADMGEASNSFGVAHRFYENDQTAETLEGGAGDDTLYVGAGSTAIGGEGADMIEVFVPDGLFGGDLVSAPDFDTEQDTFVVRFEMSAFQDEQGMTVEPDAALVPDGNGGLTLEVNETAVASLPAQDAPPLIAVSSDGYGEDFVDANGDPIPGVELQGYSIQIVLMNNASLYGV